MFEDRKKDQLPRKVGRAWTHLRGSLSFKEDVTEKCPRGFEKKQPEKEKVKREMIWNQI